MLYFASCPATRIPSAKTSTKKEKIICVNRFIQSNSHHTIILFLVMSIAH
jgi:hypothetical protein